MGELGQALWEKEVTNPASAPGGIWDWDRMGSWDRTELDLEWEVPGFRREG